MWDDKSQEIIDERKEYYDKCSIFLEGLEQNVPANLVIPKKPAIDLTVLFPAKEKKQPLAGEDLGLSGSLTTTTLYTH